MPRRALPAEATTESRGERGNAFLTVSFLKSTTVCGCEVAVSNGTAFRRYLSGRGWAGELRSLGIRLHSHQDTGIAVRVSDIVYIICVHMPTRIGRPAGAGLPGGSG